MWFCVSSYYDTAGIKTFHDLRIKGGGSYKNYNKQMTQPLPCPVGSSFPALFSTFSISTHVELSSLVGSGIAAPGKQLGKTSLEPKYWSSSEWAWGPLPRAATDPGKELLYTCWIKNRDQLCYHRVSPKPEAIFLLPGTRKDRAISK